MTQSASRQSSSQNQSRDNYLDPQTLAAIGSLELRARLIVEGLMIGMHRSPYQGFSAEFAQHRQYAAGDDLRHLDWKVFGRTDKLYLKQYQKETNLDLVVLVDASGSMGYGSAKGHAWRKYDLAASLAAALAYLAIRQQDRVGLALFADKLRDVTRLSNAHDHWRSIVGTLSSVREFPAEKGAETTGKNRNSASVDASMPSALLPTDFSRVFDQVVARLTQRSLVVVISDLFDDVALLERGLAQLHHRRHDVILFQTLDHAELSFPFRSPSQFFGLEGEGRLNLDPSALRKVYLDAIESHTRQIEGLARRFTFDYLRIDTSLSMGPPLSHFLARRAAMISKGR